MAGDWREEAQALRDRAHRQKASESKVRLLEEAVRMADAHGDVNMGYELRDDLIDAATFGGYPDKALVAFAWCRGQQKKDPERFDPEGLLWKQKWVVGRIKEFPHISRKQIADALEDIEQCFSRVNAGKRSALKLRYQAARDMGDAPSEVDRLWEAWLAAPRDHLTDCRACELDDELDHHVEKAEWEQALRKAKPIVEGRVKCAEIPHLTLGTMLYPLFKLGDYEQAAELHRRGYPMVSKNRDFLATVGDHIEFLTLTGNLARGLSLVEKHLEWTLDHGSFNDRFLFLVASTFLLEQVKMEGGRDVVSLRLTKAFPEHREDGGYEVTALHAWMLKQAKDIATRFDTRNGTDRYARRLARLQRLSEEVRDFPLD
ncbi:hypothetical protein MYSTI_01410 [Myxococcus stipitatus DSM 14675]|uniref:TPR repeat-containing protein n=1 Tax=Myxococcus stipitatus (strain DSM 14675 / JCM 12634 / Mx s8) TaxID=1278073 RepID=L7U3I4_MYXSD|nr:hypothetical protein [Myxococcus stipitatus]AGC42758.1 hypothetical protein MYSTI_01410 [Myxococcus stipitatus DSM 14675]